MFFQTVFDIVEVAIAEFAQAAADGDPAGAGCQRDAIGRFIGICSRWLSSQLPMRFSLGVSWLNIDSMVRNSLELSFIPASQ
jgi:hypothetical protein